MNRTLASVLREALQAPSWRDLARPEQLPPSGDWRIWLLLGGRGSGKTRAAAEWVTAEVMAGRARAVAVVGRTAADVRDVMVEGPSGLLTIAPGWFRPTYEPSKRRLTWPNGAQAALFSAEEPDLLRGPQHDVAWADEAAAWERGQETWDNLMLTLRLGGDPRCVVSTTPRPIPLIKDLVSRQGGDVAVTKMRTLDNAANLAPAFLQDIVARYQGTWLGRQELDAEVLTEAPGALWTRDMLEQTRVERAPDLLRVVVGVDPAVTSGESSDSTGIVVAGVGTDGEFYVLEDASCKATPDQWARRAASAFERHQADRIVAEVNNGGDMVELVIRTAAPTIPYEKTHASRGKLTRAEPISALFEQGRAHLVGRFPQLEDQLCTYVPGQPSPDRLDAMVWAVTSLLGSAGGAVTMARLVEAAVDERVEPLGPDDEDEGDATP